MECDGGQMRDIVNISSVECRVHKNQRRSTSTALFLIGRGRTTEAVNGGGYAILDGQHHKNHVEDGDIVESVTTLACQLGMILFCTNKESPVYC